MRIQKILNNNAIISNDSSYQEVIVMGKGIAYGKKTGDIIDPSRIYKTFVLNHEAQNKMVQMLQKIPIEYLELCELIVSRANNILDKPLSDDIYISLTDHIYMAVQRYKKGLRLKNKLLWEIQHFYTKEYKIAHEALNSIESMFQIHMDEDEAGFIAIHIVTAEHGDKVDDVYELTRLIQDIMNIVKYYFKIELDERSLYYQRFVTHLKFFSYRVLSYKNSKENELLKNDLLEIIKEKYVNPYLCALKIKSFVEQRYEYILDDEEILYLLIHISQVIQFSKEECSK